ncbi:MAG: dCTP deaminase [Verrucomicrobiaceae bacterium]
MILRTEAIAKLLDKAFKAIPGSDVSPDPLVITPSPDTKTLRKAGAASVDLRLGCFFAKLKRGSNAMLDIDAVKHGIGEEKLVRRHFIPFGGKFILHPRTSVLAVTLEWLRIPKNLAGYVMTRSSWGRRGLVIATGSGVHPGFSGCLTLVLTNVGELPVVLRPGTTICQFFLHQTVKSDSNMVDQSLLIGKRSPALGVIECDDVAKALGAEAELPRMPHDEAE